ncbi:MAG TPA: SRPBCC family protein [Bacteroidia bacterium]|nr:SRPBCC family protein [Bacteroidia bacterium]
MNVYTLSAVQQLSVSKEKAWDFLSNPENLTTITPPDMEIKITDGYDQKLMYAGQIICYKIKVLPLIQIRWVTEITHVNHNLYFVDEQRFGPYTFWHHKHFLEEVPGGVKMTDIVHYAIPLGWIGGLLNHLFIRNRLQKIFNYRKAVLARLFGEIDNPSAKVPAI